MKWILEESIKSKLTDFEIITGLYIYGVNTQSGTEIDNWIPKSVDLVNGILTMVVDDVHIYLTEGSFNNWDLIMYAEFNLNYVEPIATASLTSSINSSDISYFGVNIFYVNLNWDGYCDIYPIGKLSSQHIIRPGGSIHHTGKSKGWMSRYVGNERNVNLHKQLI